MRSRFLAIILIFMAVMASACRGAVTPPSLDETSIDRLIIGTWKSSCVDLGSEVFIITTIIFEADGLETDTVDFFSDPACSSATGLVKMNQSTYSLGEETLASGKNAFKIDTTITAWELKQDGELVTSGTNEPTQYDIIAIERDILFNSGLTRADPGPITAPEDRPTTLDLTNFFTRQ